MRAGSWLLISSSCSILSPFDSCRHARILSCVPALQYDHDHSVTVFRSRSPDQAEQFFRPFYPIRPGSSFGLFIRSGRAAPPAFFIRSGRAVLPAFLSGAPVLYPRLPSRLHPPSGSIRPERCRLPPCSRRLCRISYLLS